MSSRCPCQNRPQARPCGCGSAAGGCGCQLIRAHLGSVQILPFAPPDPTTNWQGWWAWNYLHRPVNWVALAADEQRDSAWLRGFQAGSRYIRSVQAPTDPRLQAAARRGVEINAAPRDRLGWSQQLFWSGFSKALSNYNAVALILSLPITWDQQSAWDAVREAWATEEISRRNR